MRRYSSEIGDVYCVRINEHIKKYFQYIVSDMTQLNSSVIRVFKKTYPIEEKTDLENVIKDEIDFYAHTVIRWGEQQKLWSKIGNIVDVGKLELLFKDPDDRGGRIGEPPVRVSEKWRIWRVGEPMKFVGKLEGTNRKAEIGSVIPAYQIVRRIREGKYNMNYPGYDENSIMTYVPDEEGERIHQRIEQEIKRVHRERKLLFIINSIIKRGEILSENEYNDVLEFLSICDVKKKKAKEGILQEILDVYQKR